MQGIHSCSVNEVGFDERLLVWVPVIKDFVIQQCPVSRLMMVAHRNHSPMSHWNSHMRRKVIAKPDAECV